MLAEGAHLLEVLQISLDLGAYVPLLHLMPVIPVAMAEAGEVCALAESHPFVAQSESLEDIAGRSVADAAPALPADVAEAARARGRGLDWWETAEELLAELRELD